MALTRVARPPPLDARLHLPFVTSTHRPILGVTVAAESALNQCPCSAFIGRATPLSRYSSGFTTSALPHLFTTDSHDDLLYPCAELSDVTSQPRFHHHIVKVPYSIRPSRHLPFLASIRIHSASSPFERPAHLVAPNAICTTWFDISYIALVSPVALICYHHRLPAACNGACRLPRAPPVLSRPAQARVHRQRPSI